MHERFIALDVLRGLTIAGMILVNMPGSWDHVYSQLHHAEWNGFTFADLIFPMFLFVMGISAWYSFRKYEFKLNRTLGRRILIRTLALFAIGIFLNAYPFYMSLADLRIMGVLQRIALVYCAGSIMILTMRADWLMIASSFILVAYWGLLAGYGTEPFSLDGNIVLAYDRMILGDSHLWQETGIPFDPEGFLSTLPAIVNMTAGYFTAVLLNRNAGKIKQITFYGIIAMLGGLAWSLVLPLNKSLWTSSYVMFTTGISMVIFAGLANLFKGNTNQKWSAPFAALGANPLFIYAISILWANTLWMFVIKDGAGNALEGYDWFYQVLFRPWAGNYLGSFLFSAVHVAVFTVVAVFLNRQKIFIRL